MARARASRVGSGAAVRVADMVVAVGRRQRPWALVFDYLAPQVGGSRGQLAPTLGPAHVLFLACHVAGHIYTGGPHKAPIHQWTSVGWLGKSFVHFRHPFA